MHCRLAVRDVLDCRRDTSLQSKPTRRGSTAETWRLRLGPALQRTALPAAPQRGCLGLRDRGSSAGLLVGSLLLESDEDEGSSFSFIRHRLSFNG